MAQGRFMMFSLNMVDYPMSFLLLSTWDFLLDMQGGPFLLLKKCLKVMVGGWWWWCWVAYSILVSAKGPLVLGLRGLGLRVWGQGLTTTGFNLSITSIMDSSLSSSELTSSKCEPLSQMDCMRLSLSLNFLETWRNSTWKTLISTYWTYRWS